MSKSRFFRGSAAALSAALAVTTAAGFDVRAAAQQSASVNWQVDWGDRYCTLGRPRMGSQPVMFAIRTIPGSSTVDVILMSSAWNDYPIGEGRPASIRLLPSGRVLETASTGRARGPNGDRAIILRGLDRELLPAFIESTELQLENQGQVRLRLPLTTTRTAATAMQQCIDGVLQQWGIDSRALAALRQQPRNHLSRSWFSSRDYPHEAAWRGASGTVVTRLSVSADARVVGCAVVASSGARELDEATCRIALRRGNYSEPAIGADGRPTAADIIMVITWWLSDDF